MIPGLVDILEMYQLQNLGRFHHLPTPGELSSMKEDLDFKQGEMEKSKTTASGLAGGRFSKTFDVLFNVCKIGIRLYVCFKRHHLA